MKLWAMGLALALLAVPALGAEPRKPGEYPPTADSLPQPGVPKGKLIGPLEFKSKVIAGTVRRYWIYVPVNYDANNPPNLLVFQDGQRAINPQGPLNIPVVLDNLIAKGDIPATLGVFITPGNTGTEHYPDNLGTGNPNHRAPEYDALSDAYTRMLIDEILPEVAKTYKFTDDPKRRAIGGTSSGRDLRLDGGVAPARRLRQCHQHDRQLHLDRLSPGDRRPAHDPGRRHLSGPDPQESHPPHPHFPAGRHQRSQQRVWQLASGQ